MNSYYNTHNNSESAFAIDSQATRRREQGFTLSEQGGIITFGFCIVEPLIRIIDNMDDEKLRNVLTQPGELEQTMRGLNPNRDFIGDGKKIKNCLVMETQLDATNMTIMGQHVTQKSLTFQALDFDRMGNFVPSNNMAQKQNTMARMSDFLTRSSLQKRVPYNLEEMNYRMTMLQNNFATHYARSCGFSFYGLIKGQAGVPIPVATDGRDSFMLSRTTAPMRDRIALTMWSQILRNVKGDETTNYDVLKDMQNNIATMKVGSGPKPTILQPSHSYKAFAHVA
jgi:hypothetical protein